MKGLFKILAYPLVLVAGFGTAYGIAEVSKLKKSNLALTEEVNKQTKENNSLETKKTELESQVVDLGMKLINSNNEITTLKTEKTNLSEKIEKLNKTIEELNNSTIKKQTEGVITGVFRMYVNSVTLPDGTIIEISEDQYYVFEETKIYMLGDKSIEQPLSLKDNKVIVMGMELTPDYENECYLLSGERIFVKSTEREGYLEFLYNSYKQDYENLEQNYNSKLTEIENLQTQINELQARIAELEKGSETVTLTAGLYEAGTTTLVKTWEQLISDGDITITNGQLKMTNTSLSGDLICGEVEGLTNLSEAFYGCSKLTSLDVSNFDTSQVTNMSSMFTYCSGLTSLDVSSFNTSQVEGMGSMFYYCGSLTSLNLSNFDTSQVMGMSSMFEYCGKLTELDLSNFDTSQVTNMISMFARCSNLTSLDLSSFNTSQVTDMGEMFSNCSNLTSLSLDLFSTYSYRDFTGMFTGFTGEITYAGTIEEWKALGFSSGDYQGRLVAGITVHCSDGDIVTE